MIIIANFIKTFKENLRDWKIIILVIVFAPFFVFLMKMYLGGSEGSTYNVALLNHDLGGAYSKELINSWKINKTEDQKNVLHIINLKNSKIAKKMIKEKTADIFITIPSDFSSSFETYQKFKTGSLSTLISYGDQKNVRFMMAGSLIDYISHNYVSYRTGLVIPLNIKYEAAYIQTNNSDFDLYVPTMLVLAIIMILFTAGASIIREVEKETIVRLSLSKISSFEFMTAISMNQVLIGLASLLLTLAAAFIVGFRTDGSILLLLLIGTITSFSVISISIITTYFIKNMFGLLTIGCFPFFILMFFSDCFIPLPKINMFSLFGNQLFLNDILPTATAIRAMNKVLNYSSHFKDISFELIWMSIMSSLYFVLGLFLFKKKYKY